jgi:hypothetical protein
VPKYTGACLCGKIRYSANADPLFMGICHCKDCQRATGSAFEAVIAVPEATLSVQGTPKAFAVKGQSGNSVHRSFCPDCGSTLMSRLDAMPGVVLLTTGPLDDPSQFKPAMQIFCASAQPWVQLGGEMMRFPGAPPQG